jgi:hypothetical protein
LKENKKDHSLKGNTLKQKRHLWNTKGRRLVRKKLREIKQEHCKTFCEGIDKFTDQSYIWDRMKRLQSRHNKIEREHVYNEEQVKSAETTFGKL